MPAVPPFIIEPIWCQFSALIPVRKVSHPKGGHRPRIDDRLVFDKIIEVLVLDCAYVKIADTTCSATTIRRRRDEWIDAGIFTELEQIALEMFDRICGLDLDNLVVDGCIVKAPCGGEAAGRSPVDRGKGGTKRSLLTDGAGIPLGAVVAPANRHDSPLLRPTLERLGRFGLWLPEQIAVHLDAGYDSTVTRDLLDELGCQGHIATKAIPGPIQNTARSRTKLTTYRARLPNYSPPSRPWPSITEARAPDALKWRRKCLREVRNVGLMSQLAPCCQPGMPVILGLPR